ncbi:hypothetical protein AGMMS50262_17080 [Bacteroidia bacterium]|nr:hypothetical protein AGMMS50262_17080 [Bacteroidia bacterium]
MRKKNVSKAFLLILLAGIVYACMEEGEFLSSKRSLPPEVSAAQKWYEDQVAGGYLEWKSVSIDETNMLKPDWRTAFWNEDENYKVTEVHLVGDEQFLFITSECADKFQETGDMRYKASDTRLVVRTNKKTKETDGFIMIMYPKLDYLEKNIDQPLRDMSYLYRNSAFSGVIYYHYLNGEFMNGWSYKAGVPYAIYPAKEATNTSNGPLKSDYYFCDYVCETYYSCRPIYYGGDYMYDYCEPYNQYCWYENCYPDTSGDGGTSGGGGGGNPGNPGNQPSPSDDAEDIIDDFDLDNTGIEKLNEILEEMLDQCGYEYVHNFLKEGGFSFSNARYSPNSTEGGFNPITKELTFKNSSSINSSFPEEFIHLYQDSYYAGGIAQYTNTGCPNIEFEAKVMQDIACIIRNGACDKLGAGKKYPIKYMEWLFEITHNGQTYPDYSDIMGLYPQCNYMNYWDFLEDFKNIPNSPYKDMPTDKDLIPGALFNISINSGCK